MDHLQSLLQISAKIYKSLETVPKGEDRDIYINEINIQLDNREKVLTILLKEGFQIDPQNSVHQMIIELDKGIRERLNRALELVKSDMKNLQAAKKHEKQYSNPYSSVRVMDGMYYDKKK